MSSEPVQKGGVERGNPGLRKVLGRGLAKASFGRLNLLVLGAAATGAALSESWSVLMFAAVGFVVLTAIKLCDGRFWTAILDDVKSEPIALPETNTLMESSARTCMERIANARLVMRQVLDDVPPTIRKQFTDAIAHVPELEGRAVVLATRIEELSRYLANISYEVIRLQMHSLESRQKTSSDSESRAQYADAHAVRAQHLAALDEIGAAKERSSAALDHVVGVLERLPTHMMMIRALEAESADHALGDREGSVGWFERELHRIEDEWRALVDGNDGLDLIDVETELSSEAAAAPNMGVTATGVSATGVSATGVSATIDDAPSHRC
jgi:hypothetical protein